VATVLHLRLIHPIQAAQTRLDFVANRTRYEFAYSIQTLHGPGSILGIETEAGQKPLLFCGRPVEAVLPRFDTAGPDSVVAAIRALSQL
jgi:hypothetical protein